MEKTYLFSDFPDYNSPGFSMENFENLFDDGTVVFNARTSNAFYAEHGGTFSLKCVFKGIENYNTRKFSYKVDESSFLVIKEDHLYSSCIDSIEDVESFSIFFNKKLVNDTRNSLAGSPAKLIEDPSALCRFDLPADVELHKYDSTMIDSLLKLKASMSYPAFSKEAIKEKLQYTLEILLLKNEEIHKLIAKIPAVNKATREEYYKRLKYVIDYMRSNYGTPVTIETLSNIACMNPSHLIRTFKKVYNQTPYAYLTNIRLEKSKQLLKQSGMTITEISSLVGFEKLSSFSYLFSNKYKIPPTRYRSLYVR